MPRLSKIVAYWSERPEFEFDPAVPSCFACWRKGPCDDEGPPAKRWDSALGWLERSHLVDRCSYGLDGVQNIVPLCYRCNRREMPCFDAGEGYAAILWVQGGGGWARPGGLGLCLITAAVMRGGYDQEDAIGRAARLAGVPELYARWCARDCAETGACFAAAA
jgi:hypothetical protein